MRKNKDLEKENRVLKTTLRAAKKHITAINSAKIKEQRLKKIATEYPYTYGTIEAVYNIIRSYKSTESILEHALKLAKCPIEVAEAEAIIRIK